MVPATMLIALALWGWQGQNEGESQENSWAGTILFVNPDAPMKERGIFAVSANASPRRILVPQELDGGDSKESVWFDSVACAPTGKQVVAGQRRVRSRAQSPLQFWSSSLVIINLETRQRNELADLGHNLGDPAWAPDGDHLIATGGHGAPGAPSLPILFVVDVLGSSTAPLGNDASGHHPSWSPDGSSIVSTSCGVRPGRGVGCWGSARGARTGELRYEIDAIDETPAWSPDGETLAYSSFVKPANGDTALRERRIRSSIDLMNLQSRQTRKLTSGIGWDRHPSWSPDGRWITFGRKVEGRSEVMIMESHGRGQPTVVSEGIEGAEGPTWCR